MYLILATSGFMIFLKAVGLVIGIIALSLIVNWRKIRFTSDDGYEARVAKTRCFHDIAVQLGDRAGMRYHGKRLRWAREKEENAHWDEEDRLDRLAADARQDCWDGVWR